MSSPFASSFRALVPALLVALSGCTEGSGPKPSIDPTEPVASTQEAVASPCTKDLQGLGAIGGGWFGIRTDGTLWLPSSLNPIGAASERVNAMGVDNVALADMDGEALHNCVLKQSGDIWCWGLNEHGQLGTGTTSPSEDAPVKVVGLPMAVKQVAVGIDSSCALLTDGTVWCWGSNQYGQLGNGQTSLVDVLAPIQVTTLGTNVDVISAGYWHTCALKSGSVYCWGDNLYGEVGNGSFGGTVATPFLVRSGVTQISAGGFYSCTVVAGNQLWCWGDNFWGQLGLNDTSGRNVPTQVSALGNTVSFVDTAVHATCAVITGGAVRCWGSQDSGRLGNGQSNPAFCAGGGCQLLPVAVSGPIGSTGGVSYLRESEGAVCALKTDGHVWCWGGGGFLDGKPPTSVPVEVDFCGLPTLDTLVPASGVYTGGQVITLTGTELKPGATVKFGNVDGTAVTVASPTSLTVTTPDYTFTDTVDVTVTNPDGHKARLLKSFVFSSPPGLSDVSPNSGSTLGGTLVTVTGASFVFETNIDFGGAPATNVTFVDASTLTAITPAHAPGPVDVTITNPGALSATLAMGFNYVDQAQGGASGSGQPSSGGGAGNGVQPGPGNGCYCSAANVAGDENLPVGLALLALAVVVLRRAPRTRSPERRCS